MTAHGAINVALPPRASGGSLAGRVVLRSVGRDAQQRYYQYVPAHLVPGRTLVSVHGISRNARDHARLLAPLADRYGVTVIAPLFDEALFSDYQRLGRRGRGRRADLALNDILNDALGTASPPAIRLFGYSGGGQFAHRYTLAYPDRVVALALAAPGWFTFPDTKRRYPYGLARADGLPGIRFEPERFLRVPTLVLVGAHDVERGARLRRSRRLDADQGRDRVARGRRWVSAMCREASRLGITTRHVFECMPNTDHDFVAAMTRDGMGVAVFEFLFGDANQKIVR